jgi:predicted amidophosphoribosyltransferase
VSAESGRLARERKTIEVMIKLYCEGQHGNSEELCPSCTELLHYANQRLDRCPFQADKPTCAQCTVHCYKPEMRARVRAVMRYSGPRMLRRRPVLALLHLFDGWRSKPRRSGH